MTAPACPSCEGRGYTLDDPSDASRRIKCVVCNGTKVLPLNHYQATLRESGRIAGIRRAQRRR